jgi:hypothetical protein
LDIFKYLTKAYSKLKITALLKKHDAFINMTYGKSYLTKDFLGAKGIVLTCSATGTFTFQKG